jgi:hypothetical protein
MFYLTENGRRRPQSECQVEVERDIGRAADIFVEYQGFDGVGAANNWRGLHAQNPITALTISWSSVSLGRLPILRWELATRFG